MNRIKVESRCILEKGGELGSTGLTKVKLPAGVDRRLHIKPIKNLYLSKTTNLTQFRCVPPLRDKLPGLMALVGEARKSVTNSDLD